jgi:amino-acid N-acetyltransferase
MATRDGILPRIEAAKPDDLSAILALLAAVHLPEAGIASHMTSTLVVRSAAGLAGCIALEIYGESALLRSAAVAPSWQGRGLGKALTAAALDFARQRSVREVYLLTDTAAGFYPKFGFRPISRDEIAPALHESEELRGDCPDTAQAMALRLSAQA